MVYCQANQVKKHSICKVMLIGLKNYIRIYRVQNGLKLQNSMAPSGTISFYSLFIAYFKNGIMYLIGRKTE